MFSVLLSLFTEETKRDTSDRIPLYRVRNGKKDKSVCCVIGDGCEHRGNASLHLATVKHHGGIKAHQCSMCLYLVWETTLNVRECGATPLGTPLSTLYNNRKFVFIPKFGISSDRFCQVTKRWHPLITKKELKRNRSPE
jgi:hypothetical protein